MTKRRFLTFYNSHKYFGSVSRESANANDFLMRTVYTKPMRERANAKRLYEIVSFFIYDLGRAVDLDKAQEAVRVAGFPVEPFTAKEKRKVQSRDTPASLSLPTPFCFPVGESGYEKIADVGRGDQNLRRRRDDHRHPRAGPLPDRTAGGPPRRAPSYASTART